MRKGLFLFLTAGLWELARFGAIFVTLVAGPSAIPNDHLNLLWLAAPGIVLSLLFFMCAYYPDRVGAYLPILRIGVLLSNAVNLSVLITGSFDWTTLAASSSSITGRLLFLIAFSVLVLDLVLLALLLTFRKPRTGGGLEDTTEDLPSYDPEHVDEV